MNLAPMNLALLGETTIGKSLLRSAHLQTAHRYRGRKDLDSAESDADYESVRGVHSACCESDDSAGFSDSFVDQTISTLEAQLAKLKTSVEKDRTRKKFTQPRDFVKLAAQPVCSACGKNGHSKSDRKCPARSSKCHNCERLGHWSTVCHSPTVTGTPGGRATPRIKGNPKSGTNKRTQRALFVGPGSYFSGSNGKKQASDSVDSAPDSTPPNYAEGTDQSFNPEISPDSPSVIPDTPFSRTNGFSASAGTFVPNVDSAAGSYTTEQLQHL